MQPPVQYASARDYLRVVREQRLLVSVIVILCAAAGLALSVREDPVYQSEAALLFLPATADLISVGQPVPSFDTPEQRAAINAQAVGDAPVIDRAAEILGPDFPRGSLVGAVSGRVETQTNLVVVTARADDGADAARIANAFADAIDEVKTADVRSQYRASLRALRRSLRDIPKNSRNDAIRIGTQSRISGYEAALSNLNPVDVVRRAGPARTPVSPKPVRSTTVGILAGILVALLAAFLRDSLDRRFRSYREAADAIDAPILAYVPRIGRNRRRGVDATRLAEIGIEPYRFLRAAIDSVDIDTPPQVVMVTSSLPEEGKSTVVAMLAQTYAAAGKRTLVVECDLRRPVLAGRLGTEPGPGLAEFLLRQAEPGDVVRAVGVAAADGEDASTFTLIPAGSPPQRPGELLGSERFGTFLDEVRAVYDVILIDSGPLLAVADAVAVAPRADAIVMCVHIDTTTRDQLRTAVARLEAAGHRPAGLVVSGKREIEGLEGGYYAYSYAYGPTGR